GRINTLQEQNKRDREATEDLRKELREKSASSSKAIESSMASLKVNDSKREERLIAEATNRKKELEIKEAESKSEQSRLKAESEEKVKQMKTETKATQDKADREARRQAKQEEKDSRWIGSKA